MGQSSMHIVCYNEILIIKILLEISGFCLGCYVLVLAEMSS